MGLSQDLRHLRLAALPHLPLTLFTLLGQWAVGLAWMNLLQAASDAWPLSAPSLLVGPVLMAVALGASFFHLHSPWNARRSLSNWRSPLSQEALAAALFMALLSLETAGTAGWMPWVTLPTWLGGLVSLTGLVLIGTMIRLYRLRTVPVWNRLNTVFSFLATALLLGGCTALLQSGRPQPRVLGALALGLVLRFGAARKVRVKRLAGAIQDSRHVLPVWWIALSRPWVPLAGLALVTPATGLVFNDDCFLVFGLVLTFWGELADRVLFYARHGHDRSVFPPVTPAVSSWRETLE
jgi:DMSO reductase anchor subunit